MGGELHPPSHGGVIIPAEYRPFIVAVLRWLMFLTMYPLPYCSVSKPDKLIVSPEWTLVEVYLSVSSVS